jgi:Flp pilus assembly pilin Flp
MYFILNGPTESPLQPPVALAGRAFDKYRDRSHHRNHEMEGGVMSELLRRIWAEDRGQDIAEYAVMLAVILVIVVGTIRLIGSNANTAFSSVASSIQ